jgi:LCP family protein required for cell wall assembly
MGKHSSKGTSYWEARSRRKDLRARTKPPKRKGPTKKRWLALFLVIGLIIGGLLGYYAKPIGKLGAKVYLAIKQGQWQPKGKEKQEVAESLNPISQDPSKSVNTLVIGSDLGSNKGEKGWARSDVMMLVCFQERDKKAVVISIPRDTRVMIPGRGTNKVNAAHSYGGPSAAIDTVKQLLGIDVNHYVSMNFEGFKQIINTIGGVPIHLNKPINDPHAGYLPAGDLLLDGWQALVLVRSRKLPGGDLDRIKAQQAFLKALMDKAYKMRNVWKAKQMIDIVSKYCQMDYSGSDLLTLAEEARGFKMDDVQFVTIPGTPKNIGGLSYYVVNEPAVAQLVSEVEANTQVSPEMMADLQRFEAGSQSRVEEVYGPDADVITVLGGARKSTWAVPVVAEELRLLGHEKVFEGGLSKEVHARTTVYYRGEAKKACEHLKKSVPELADADEVQNDQVAIQYNSPLVVVLGPDFVTPNILSIYGRTIKPAVQLDNLGKQVKSFT